MCVYMITKILLLQRMCSAPFTNNDKIYNTLS